MSDYGWKGRSEATKDFPKGLSKGLRTLDLNGKKVESVGLRSDESEVGTTVQMYHCLVSGCDKKFKATRVAANHFRAKHGDLNVEKDSWRDYVGPV